MQTRKTYFFQFVPLCFFLNTHTHTHTHTHTQSKRLHRLVDDLKHIKQERNTWRLMYTVYKDRIEDTAPPEFNPTINWDRSDFDTMDQLFQHDGELVIFLFLILKERKRERSERKRRKERERTENRERKH